MNMNEGERFEPTPRLKYVSHIGVSFYIITLQQVGSQKQGEKAIKWKDILKENNLALAFKHILVVTQNQIMKLKMSIKCIL